MRFSFIEPHMHCVGGIRRIIEVTNGLISLGHHVDIYTPAGKPCRWLKGKANVIELSKIHKTPYDIVLFNLAEQYPWALKSKAKKRVFWVLAPEANYKAPDIPIAALQNNFYFMTNSVFTKKYILGHRKVQYNIPVIPGGINPEHFKFDRKIPKNYHILYYGSARPWKGTKLIEDALNGLKLKVLKMEGLGTPQNKMYTLYNQCTCFVSACFSEGFGFPILEAMACGCPVICTDDGGNRDFVIPSRNAIRVERTAEGIRRGIHRVLTDKVLRQKLRSEGLKTARQQKYTWKSVTKQVETVFLNLLKGKL